MLKQAAREALGDDGVAILASAMRCSQARFEYGKPRTILVAVLELIECATANGLPRSSWPQRWHVGGVSASADGQRLKTRFEELFGSDGLISRLAFALDMSCEGLRTSLYCDRRRCLNDLHAVVELLEYLQLAGIARSNWPQRWRMSERRMHRKKRSKKQLLPDPACLLARVNALFESRFPSATFARAIGRTPDSLSRVWRRERDSHGRVAVVQAEIVALVELLEALKSAKVPVDHWPERWRASIRL